MSLAQKIEERYRAQLFVRYDDTGNVFYFSPANFPGLSCTPYAFRAVKRHRMQGYFYSYKNPLPDRLVVFDHGMGGGHRAYMKEIELLARHGYLVFAYDHTGCMESEGDSAGGFTQSLSDLHACLAALQFDPKYNRRRIAVVGHSWGAYACLNIAALHPDVTHIVAMAGFLSVERILRQNFRGVMRGFARKMYAIEQAANPDFVHFDATESLRRTDARVLVLHAPDDPVVSAREHFDVLRREMADCAHIRFLATEGKRHNPNYTQDAIQYKDAFFADLQKKLKKNALSSAEEKEKFVAAYDWDRMTAQDAAVWDEIFSHLGVEKLQ